MPIKSILLHLGSSQHLDELLACAVSVADAHGACIDVLYTTLPLHAPASAMGGRGGTGGYIADRAAQALEKAGAVKAKVAAALGNQTWTWEISDQDHADALGQRATLADLVIVPQAHPDQPEEWVQVQNPEDLVLREPVPVLVVPWNSKSLGTLDQALIAWDGTVGVARAVRGALPVLRATQRVDVLYMGRDADIIAKAEKLISYLGRHGIKADLQWRADDDAIADRILLEADKLGSNFLITGAFGSSMLHNFVFGSTSRKLLENTTLPMIICH